jgi:hypothetical protein
MARERDKLLGAPRPDDRASARPVAILMVLLVVGAGLAFIIGRAAAPENDAPTSQAHGANETGGRPATEASESKGAKPDAGSPAAPAADPGAQATTAEFLITDALLMSPPTYEDLEAEAISTSVCIGDTLRIGNVSSRRVGLLDTPEASDASVSLGFVEPGAVFTIRPRERGTFYISEPDGDGLLFRYRARRCSGKR